MSETALVRRLMLAATNLGARLFRNSVGQHTTESGRTIRYGLCVGSSDLIGWTQHVVTAADIGRTVAIFTAVEAKTARGRATAAQLRFLAAVRAAGGIAIVARTAADLEDGGAA